MPIGGSALKVSELPPAHSLFRNDNASGGVEKMTHQTLPEGTLFTSEKGKCRKADG